MFVLVWTWSVLLVSAFEAVDDSPAERGTLGLQVRKWAMDIQRYILKLASDGMSRDLLQSYFDRANYRTEKVDGMEIVKQVKENMGGYFHKKNRAGQRLAKKLRELYDEFVGKNKTLGLKLLSDLKLDVYKDSDLPNRLPDDLEYSPQYVSMNYSVIKIPDDVPRNDPNLIDSVHFTKEMDVVFKQNAEEDSLTRWQYLGCENGLVRIYPGFKWFVNFAGFPYDVDPRVRPWYIASTSGPKDVVILLDCSVSMTSQKFAIAKAVAQTAISTLTKQDYVNVVCARSGHWDPLGAWHSYETEVLSCEKDKLVPATLAHRKDLGEKLDRAEPGGATVLEKGFEVSFSLLGKTPRTGCQAIIIFVTDGLDTDGDGVTCGPGYYTRSGYVPGTVCKYDWNKEWNLVEERNKRLKPRARIFSYLIQEDSEELPGKLACSHRGNLKKLVSAENIISQMGNYFDFLESNTRSNEPIWTSPYLDNIGQGLMVTHAVPVNSEVNGRNIGVVGLDAIMDEIERFLTKQQWGSVYSFLINKQGETIFHPSMKSSTMLVDDPVFVPISQLERDRDGNPAEFSIVERDMRQGKTGKYRISKSKGGSPRTYFYTALPDSEYSFAYSLADTDLEFRRLQDPENSSLHNLSFFHLLTEYNSSLLREALPGLFESLLVNDKVARYLGQPVSYETSSVFVAPFAYCRPTEYLYEKDVTASALKTHRWFNGWDEDVECSLDKTKWFDKGVRAAVRITQPIEDAWKKRTFDLLPAVKWTTVSLQAGVFRSYPGHRSDRSYDFTKEPWYVRTISAPHRTFISTPYMDDGGLGKMVSISQAIFEGVQRKSDEECARHQGQKPSGCGCEVDGDCSSGYCYTAMDSDSRQCAMNATAGVISLHLYYDDLQKKVWESVKSDGEKSCGQTYRCPDGEPDCQTRCYLFDNFANLVVHPDFLTAPTLDSSQYVYVTLGQKEGETMKDLVYRHGFFKPTTVTDMQGVCRTSAEFPKATFEGIPVTPEEKEKYFKTRDKIGGFNSLYGCMQDIVGYKVNDSVLGASGLLKGILAGPCTSGIYYVKVVPQTNLYLLVIEDWKVYQESLFYNFNCHIARSIVNSGRYHVPNGTCIQQSTISSNLDDAIKCPSLLNINISCAYTRGVYLEANIVTIIGFLLLSLLAAGLSIS